MYLKLYIDGIERCSRYLDETSFLRREGGSFEERSQELEKRINDEVLRIKFDFWRDLAVCNVWEVVAEAKSRANRKKFQNA